MGFVNINHITARYKISATTAYARLRKVISVGLLSYERVIHNKPGCYTVTKEGSKMDSIELPAIRQISLAKYNHAKLIADLSIKLSEQYQTRFIPERELRFEMDWEGVGNRGHLPDGALDVEDKRVAIEVELSTKGKRRLQNIVKSYLKNFQYKEVWYFCGSKEVKNLVQEQARGHDFIKVHLLSDWVSNA